LFFYRSFAIALNKTHRLNDEINAPEVRLIGVEGEQLGVVSSRKANALAEEAGLDLVEIAPLAVPPVCRILDYGKFKYQEAKKAHEAKMRQKQVQIKEVKLRPGTDENDYQIKLRNMARFLEEEDKVKVTLRFRGREMAHQEIGMRQLERIRVDLEEVAQVEQMPKMEGRQMVMMLAPARKKAEKPVKPKTADGDDAEGVKRAATAKGALDAVSEEV
jgi:translation initiation factor IF-3